MIVDEAFNNPDSRRGQVLDWITHHSGWFIAAYAGLCVGTWISATNWLVIPALVVAVSFCGAVLVAALHSQLTRICLACMREVPVNASELAHRHRWLLRVRHTWTGRGAMPVLLVLVTVPLFVTALLPAAYSGLGVAPLELWVIAAGSSERFHHRLRPWCPYCKDWGEDGDIKEPAPDPVNHDSLIH
ncbi:hypothetical protein OHB26_03885 [Nocardia sp. NBC_01503]|uniref:hypothetical protein n=1 Tax=Nocardia sp. NBC_01503 TaxID=2975997 RepID=UPI002E7B1B3E|nr:hypothetical protein [Nocardia sp. NBC_01503]WTL33397.1 hypothetical protein OHB26_03885 [Nocardia sp. NBC_01503]